MDLITIVLSSLLTLASPVNLVADRVVEGAIRDRLYDAEMLNVRIDNVPNFRFVDGRVDRIRIAGRGVYPVPELRIDIFDVETDPIDVDFPELRAGHLVLDESFQAAAHMVLRTEDLNRLLQSQRVQAQLDQLRFNLPGGSAREANRYGLANPQITVLPNSRLQIRVDLRDRVLNEEVEALVESGVEVIAGQRLVLVEPSLSIDGEPVPQQLLQALIDGINSRLDLRQLAAVQVTARILQFQLQPEALDVAVFVRVEPASPLLEN